MAHCSTVAPGTGSHAKFNITEWWNVIENIKRFVDLHHDDCNYNTWKLDTLYKSVICDSWTDNHKKCWWFSLHGNCQLMPGGSVWWLTLISLVPGVCPVLRIIRYNIWLASYDGCDNVIFSDNDWCWWVRLLLVLMVSQVYPGNIVNDLRWCESIVPRPPAWATSACCSLCNSVRE